MNLLPSFANRARMGAASNATRRLEWRLVAPRRVDEELTGLGLGCLGARAIAEGLSRAPNTTLGELCLGSNGIGDDGARALAEALRLQGSALRRLSLCNNSIGDTGADALAAALAENTMLEEIDLWSNPLSPAAKRKILLAAKCEVFLESSSLHRLSPVSSAGSPNHKMRAILFDWIAQVHTGVNAPMALDSAPDPQEMLFRTFSHMDAYLALRGAERSELQLVGVACTLTAAVPEGGVDEAAELATWLAFVTDGSFTAQDVSEAADRVRRTLGFQLHRPTSYTFLRRFLRRTGWTEESFSLANYLVELAAIDSACRTYRPQAIAAAAAVLSRHYAAQGISIRQMPRWKTKLLLCAQVDMRRELAPCIVAMSRMHKALHGREDLFVNKKYEWARLHKVARLVPNAPTDISYYVNFLQAD